MGFALPRILFLENDLQGLCVVVPGLHGGQQITQLRIGAKSRHRQQSYPSPSEAHKWSDGAAGGSVQVNPLGRP
jgi:hypothetical protein